jgi:hypothetical protein
MNIQTKYNIGQFAWITIILKGVVKAKEVEICGISVYKNSETFNIEYEFWLDGIVQKMDEPNFFETKEKLAESIINS